MVRERRIETSFASRVATGRGVGMAEAVAAAEARLLGMREGACEEIGAMLDTMQAARPAIATEDAETMRFVHVKADALVGLCDLFGLPEIGEAALSLCKLFDHCEPENPTADGVRVHLDALRMFWSADPQLLAHAAPKVLQGLRQIVLAARAVG